MLAMPSPAPSRVKGSDRDWFAGIVTVAGTPATRGSVEPSVTIVGPDCGVLIRTGQSMVVDTSMLAALAGSYVRIGPATGNGTAGIDRQIPPRHGPGLRTVMLAVVTLVSLSLVRSAM